MKDKVIEQLAAEVERLQRAYDETRRELEEKTRDIDGYVKDLNCLYSIANLVEEPGISLPEILQGTVELIPPAWQHPEIAGARLTLEDESFFTGNFEPSPWCMTADVVVHHERRGVLEVCYLEKRPESDEGPFLEEERRLLNIIAERTGRIIERVQAERALQKRNQELALFHRAGQAFSSTLDLEQVLGIILTEVSNLLGAVAASIWLVDPETEDLVCRRVTGPRSEIVRGWRLARGQGIAGWAMAEGCSVVVPDTRDDDRHFKGVDRMTGISLYSILAVPLRVKHGLIGVLQVVDIHPQRFDESDLELLEPLAASAAGAIENAQLYEAVREAHQRMERLAQQVLSVQEEERKRVSRELHDEAGQALTALKIGLELLVLDLPSGQDALRKGLEESIALADETMEQIRLLAHDLHPPAIDAMGLTIALEGLCQEFSERTRLPVHYVATDPPLLPDASSVCLYRLLQEALTNIARHAQATRVRVAIRYDAEAISLSVVDDGVGFDASVPLREISRSGMGLVGMEERLALVGGEIQIEARPGEGTRLVASIPWSKDV